ncbi:sensor histidine kinase [Arthrobacter tecti]
MEETADRPGKDGHVGPKTLDGLLAAGMALAVAVVIASDIEGTGAANLGAYGFAVGFGLLMLVRRRYPRTVLCLTIFGIFAYYSFGYPPIGISLPAVAALYSTAESGRTRWAAGAGAMLVAVSAFFLISEGKPTAYLLSYELITNIALIGAAIILGLNVRMRRQTKEQQARLDVLTAADRARHAESRVREEKIRMARDLHDVVGHTMSVIAVHSNVAAEAIGRDDENAARAVEQIRTAATRTMAELRSTVKLLRSPESGEARAAVGLDGVDSVLRAAQETGLVLRSSIAVDTSGLSSAVDAAAYRIIQESLTNIIRHSNATKAQVTASVDRGVLKVEIYDDGNGLGQAQLSDTDPMATGHGLIGMRERATALGGYLSAKNAPGGGFTVKAQLPTRLDP